MDRKISNHLSTLQQMLKMTTLHLDAYPKFWAGNPNFGKEIRHFGQEIRLFGEEIRLFGQGQILGRKSEIWGRKGACLGSKLVTTFEFGVLPIFAPNLRQQREFAIF